MLAECLIRDVLPKWTYYEHSQNLMQTLWAEKNTLYIQQEFKYFYVSSLQHSVAHYVETSTSKLPREEALIPAVLLIWDDFEVRLYFTEYFHVLIN